MKKQHLELQFLNQSHIRRQDVALQSSVNANVLMITFGKAPGLSERHWLCYWEELIKWLDDRCWSIQQPGLGAVHRFENINSFSSCLLFIFFTWPVWEWCAIGVIMVMSTWWVRWRKPWIVEMHRVRLLSVLAQSVNQNSINMGNKLFWSC